MTENEIGSTLQNDDVGETNAKPITLIESYEDKIGQILDSLDIKGDVANKILTQLKVFNNSSKYQIITSIEEYLDELLDADKKIAQLIKPGGALYSFESSIKDQWDKTMAQLGQLQGILLLERVSSANYTDAINGLLEAFTGKMTIVNKILSSKLEGKKDKKKEQKEETTTTEYYGKQIKANDKVIEEIKELLNKKPSGVEANNPDRLNAYKVELEQYLAKNNKQFGGSAETTSNIQIGNLEIEIGNLEKKLKEVMSKKIIENSNYKDNICANNNKGLLDKSNQHCKDDTCEASHKTLLTSVVCDAPVVPVILGTLEDKCTKDKDNENLLHKSNQYCKNDTCEASNKTLLASVVCDTSAAPVVHVTTALETPEDECTKNNKELLGRSNSDCNASHTVLMVNKYIKYKIKYLKVKNTLSKINLVY